MPTRVLPEVATPAFEIAVDGQPLSPEMAGVVEAIEVNDALQAPAMFSLRVNVLDSATQEVSGEILDLFKMKGEVTLAMGLEEQTRTPMMVGEVTGLEPSFGGEGDGVMLTVTGLDRLHRLRFGRYRRSFLKMKDSDLAKTFASEAGLSVQADATTVAHSYLLQNNQSNLEFLAERAQWIHYEIACDDKTLLFRKSREKEAATLTLEYRRDLLWFTLRQRTNFQGSEVTVRGWDVKGKKAISAKAGLGDAFSKMGGTQTGAEISALFGPSSLAIVDQAVLDASEAKVIATARFNALLEAFITGEGRCLGAPELRAGKTIEITGLGAPFDGIYYVTSSTHSIRAGQGYQTEFKVRRSGI